MRLFMSPPFLSRRTGKIVFTQNIQQHNQGVLEDNACKIGGEHISEIEQIFFELSSFWDIQIG